MIRNLQLTFSLTVILLLVGCQPSATVKGKVTGGGKAVNGGNIILQPLDESSKPAAGEIEKDGTFVLRTAGDDGLTPGSYEVLFTAPLPVENGTKLGPPSKWQAWKAPRGPIAIEPGENDITIELTQD